MELERRLVKYVNGEYLADVDITVDEWKLLLKNHAIFDTASLDMIRKWYSQIGFQATSGEIMAIYKDEYINHRGTPFNGIVKGLSFRITKHLNRFEYFGTTGKQRAHYIIPFECWHNNYKTYGAIVWKLRNELIQAITELSLFEDARLSIDDELTSIIHIESESEGRKIQYFATRYERSQKNRNAAIQIHGLCCCVCGFDFEAIYGELGRNYIEVHHNKPLHSVDEEVTLNIESDLDCVCSNCHRMLHRKKDRTLSTSELKNIMKNVKNGHNKNSI